MKTRYITAIAAAALMLAGCQRESLVADSDVQYDGKISYAPGVAGIGSGSAVGVRSGLTDGSAVIGSESLTLRSADGRFTIPMTLTVTGAQAADVTSGAPTKSTLINEKGGITASDFATAISSTFWVAAWSNDATPVQIIPDAYARDEDEDGNLENHGFLAGGYVSANKEYQKVVYRTKDAEGEDLETPYWMTVQPGSADPADDEYKWKKNEAEKTFYAYANVPAGAIVAQLYDEGTLKQTLTLTELPDADILMGYYRGDGSTGAPEKQTGTAKIQFHHPLAAVKFKTGTLASGVTITGVAIEKVYGKVGEGDAGKLMVTQEGHSFTWTRADGEAFKEENLLPEFVATCDGEAALVIPQSFPSDSKARIRVTLQQDDETFNVYTTLSGSWSAGYVYTYTIEYNPLPEELLPGKFSISPTEYARFSRGNLQATYHSSSSSYSWAFAANQYDYVGNADGNTSINDDGTNNDGAVVDLFGWSTDANNNYGISNSTTAGDYSGSFKDWGNIIGEGNIWSTLSKDEWDYLFSNAEKFGYATIEEAKGIILLPDEFTDPQVQGESGNQPFSTSSTTGWDANKYSVENWKVMEDAGAVFLPRSGYRTGTELNNVDTYGQYWSSTPYTDSNAYLYSFKNNGKEIGEKTKARGCFVRLVQRFPKSYVKIGDLYIATTNIGASSPKDYGWYFFWGGTTGYIHKDSKWVMAADPTVELSGGFNWKNAPFNNGNSDYDGTYFSSVCNDVCPEGVLAPNYDAAHVNLGGIWRMPTADDFKNLYNACGGTGTSCAPSELKSSNPSKGIYWVTAGQHFIEDYNGVTGLLFCDGTSMVFFPAAGYGDGNNFNNEGTDGIFWSSSLAVDHSKAYGLGYYSTYIDPQFSYDRIYGRTIRPVHD